MLNRRKLFNVSLAGSAAALLGTPVIRSAAQTTPGGTLTPFVDELPLPPAPTAYKPEELAAGFPDLSPDASPHVGPACRHYKIIAEVRRVKFHSALPETEIWGYRDGHPSVTAWPWPYALGPTFREPLSNHNKKAGVIVRHVNMLPKVYEHRGFGEPRLSVHLHGAHVPYQFDGFPGKVTLAGGKVFNPNYEHGQHYDYAYPLVDPNFPGGPQAHGDHFERATTLWYHDHALDFTGPNVYRGLAGFFLLYDNPVLDAADEFRDALAPNTLDTNNENDVEHDGIRPLRLPSGRYDIPLVLQEKTFGSNGELVFDQFDTDGFLGQHYLVNGKVQPYLDVQRRKYRFRFLNGSNARIYQLFLTDPTGRSWPMTQIATEGGLLSKSITRPSCMLSMAERVEVVIDFSKFPYPQFTDLYIENRMVQRDGRGPDGKYEEPALTSRGTRLIKFRLGPVDHEDRSAVPDILRPFPPICAGDIAAARKRTRTFEFERGNGQWQINGKLAGDLGRPMTTAIIGVPEVWRLVNKSGGWWHPIHVHHEFMRVLTRNGRRPFDGTQRDYGQPVEADGVARKDTILLGPNSVVEVYLRFSNYGGPYVFHCHNMEHEDHQMMARFDVLPNPGAAFVSSCSH